MPQFILNAVAALVGTLTAGAIGFFFAIHRFRRERAFDHRLEWHQKAVDQLVKASELLRQATISMQVPELEDDLSHLFEEVAAAMPGVSLLLEAEMYASRESYQAIEEAFRDQGELVVANVQIHNTAKHRGEAAIADRISPKIIEAVAVSMHHAASRLASDVREYMGLEPLRGRRRLYDDHEMATLADDSNRTALDRAKRIDTYKILP